MGWTYTLAELAVAAGAPQEVPDVGFSAISTDTRTLSPGDLFFALRGPNFDGADYVEEAFAKGACAAVTSKASDAGPCVIVADPLQALQALAAFHRRRCEATVLALTGSCGKTTSKDLVASVLATRHNVVATQGNLNNDIGCPLSLLRMNTDTDVAVLEMGANHPGEIASLCSLARPNEAAITMIAPAHLEGFGTVDKVAEAKAEIVDALPADGVFYLNTDDAHCVRIAERFPGETVTFGQDGEVSLQSYHPGQGGEAVLCVAPVGELRLPLVCRAHAQSVLLAVAVGLHNDVEEFEAPLREALLSSPRVKLIEVGHLRVLDDTYNANPASMTAALESLADNAGRGARIAVLGDMFELGRNAPALHRELGERAYRAGVGRLLLLGEHAADVAAGARDAGLDNVEVYADHASLAAELAVTAPANATILVKGSRGMRMERVIELLRERFAEDKG